MKEKKPWGCLAMLGGLLVLSMVVFNALRNPAPDFGEPEPGRQTPASKPLAFQDAQRFDVDGFEDQIRECIGKNVPLKAMRLARVRYDRPGGFLKVDLYVPYGATLERIRKEAKGTSYRERHGLEVLRLLERVLADFRKDLILVEIRSFIEAKDLSRVGDERVFSGRFFARRELPRGDWMARMKALGAVYGPRFPQ